MYVVWIKNEAEKKYWKDVQIEKEEEAGLDDDVEANLKSPGEKSFRNCWDGSTTKNIWSGATYPWIQDSYDHITFMNIRISFCFPFSKILFRSIHRYKPK